MGGKLETEQVILRQPVGVVARILLVLSLIAMVAALRFPLWTMSFQSNQYPDPLRLAIHANELRGQKSDNRDDLREVNSLNHYIGMRPLAERDFSEFLWIPFVLGFLGLLALRVAALGVLKDLVDVIVLYIYFGGFSAWSFYRRLWEYGHVLSPDAPIKVQPFMPPVFGKKQVANFFVESYPGLGSYALAAFGLLLAAALLLTLRTAWRARAPERTSVAAATEPATVSG